jgi:hypothetical protein
MPSIQPIPGMEVIRDEKGNVRQLLHAIKSFRPSSKAISPSARDIADEYIRQVNHLLGLPLTKSSHFAAPIQREQPGPDEDDVRFQEEKSVAGTATVSYAQTKFGIPVWNAGITVRLRTQPMEVTGAQNEFHYDIGEIGYPPPEAEYLPAKITAERFTSLFPPHSLPSAPRFNAQPRLCVYQFISDERIYPAIARNQHLSALEVCPPTLELRDIGPMEEGRHYVVSEVLFALALPNWGHLNWRAFVEVETGSVLYLRALIACAFGKILPSDPVTLAGAGISVSSPIAALNALQTAVPLRVHPPDGSGQQILTSSYVQVKDIEDPTHSPPVKTSPYEFFYSTDTQDFAAVNAFHHCDSFFHLIEDMGIPLDTYFDGTEFPVCVDHFALNGAVNAMAPGNALGNGSDGFRFGRIVADANIGIAADVRVILHEFGHAILWDHVNDPNFGFAHSPGDSLAAILHDPLSHAPDRYDTFPFMTASHVLERRHDRRVEEGWAWGGPSPPNDGQYGSEQILSTTLFRVYRACGGDDASSQVRKAAALYVAYLIIKSLSLLRFTTREPSVYAAALMEADLATPQFKGRPGGCLHKVIRWSFECQGLYQLTPSSAPVFSRGAPPEFDVFIDDGRNGEYLPYLQDVPQTSAIWNRIEADGEQNEMHQQPLPHQKNHLYAKVGNRGKLDAVNVALTAYLSTGPELMWPSQWQALETRQVPHAVLSGREEVVGPFVWVPTSSRHTVLLSATADGDESSLGRISFPVCALLLVNTDNNISMRAL